MNRFFLYGRTILFWLAVCIGAGSRGFSGEQPPSGLENVDFCIVQKEIINGDNMERAVIGTYSLKTEGCALVWEVNVPRPETEGLVLRTRSPLGVKCDKTFTEQLPLHRQVLREIFKDWPRERFGRMFIGPLESVEPAGTWNIRVAAAAAASPEWRDWRLHYPNHASGKSINQLFVELAGKADACRELEALFQEFGLTVRLNSVEKVFAQPAAKLSFYPELKRQGVNGNQKLIYDAGMIWFSVSLTEAPAQPDLSGTEVKR